MATTSYRSKNMNLESLLLVVMIVVGFFFFTVRKFDYSATI